MPSLYESTVNTGEVSSSNFTTLYNASGLSVPNAGAGQITGNLNVGGNLTVQGSSLLIGEVTLQSTLSLPNYTFPLPDGTTDQVLVTDGNGNLYWTDVTAIPGAAYSISATAATGGANLTLEDSAGGTDSVKFAGSAHITVTRTDANTITISTDADNIPDGTANGQLLVWENSAWTANNEIVADTATGRFTPIYKNSSAGVNNIIFARKDYGASTYTTGDGSGLAFQLKSNTQAENTIGVINTNWSATTPQITLATNINQNTLGPFVTVAGFTSAQATVPGDLAVNGGDITTTQTTGNVFNTTATTVNAFGAATAITMAAATGTTTVRNNLSINGETLKVNADNTAADSFVYLKGTTQYLKWNNSTNLFELSNGLQVGGNATVLGNYSQTGETMTINSDSTAADSYLYMKGSTEYLKWDNTNTRFELSDQLYITQTDIPAVLERRSLSADLSPYEQKSGVKLLNRVTDAANNDTVITGPCVLFGRTSGATDPTERIFATMGSNWNGGTQKAELTFNWSSDNFAEPTPGNFPNTYTLLRLASDNAKFQNNSIYVDYSTAGAAKIGINTGTPAYTLDVNGDANVSGDIYISGVHVDLTTPVHQGQMLYVSNDVTPTITNSSLINFTDINYRPNFQANVGTNGRTQSGAIVSNNTGAVNYTTGDGSSLLFGVDSNSQTISYAGSISTAYNTSGDHQIRLSTSPNNFASDKATSITGGNTLVFPSAHGFSIGDKLSYTSPTQNGLTYNTVYYVIATGFTTTQCQISTTLGGSAVALTNGTGLTLWFYNGIKRVLTATSASVDILAPTIVLNATNTGIPFTGSAGITVERGTTGADQTFVWDETYDFWRASGDLYADNYVIGGVGLATNGNDIFFNNEDTSPAGDCNLQVKSGVSAGVNANFRWNDTTKRWQDTTNGSTYLNLPNQNLDTTDDVAFGSVAVDGVTTYNSQTTTTTSLTTTSISNTTRVSQKVVIKIIDNVTGELHMLEALAFRKGTTAYLTTYAEMYTNAALATFTADVSAGSTRILATPASTNSTTFTVARISLD